MSLPDFTLLSVQKICSGFKVIHGNFRLFFGNYMVVIYISIRDTDLVHKCGTFVSHILNGLFTNCGI